MNERSFQQWAELQGLDQDSIAQLLRYAPHPQQWKGPPLYPLHQIQSCHESGRHECAKDNDGFMIIYNFPNGDRIALDIENEKGTVWYLGNAETAELPVRASAVKAFRSVKDLVEASFNDDEDVFPAGYQDARKRWLAGDLPRG